MYMSLTRKKMKSLVVVVLLVGIVGLTFLGGTQRFVNYIGLEKLHQHNQQYLQSSLNQSLATFAVLSGIKVGLAILEGSELGFGFGIEIGDAVQSAYDFVDIAWRTVLASSVILMGTQFLLNTSQLLEPWFLCVTLFLILLSRLTLFIHHERYQRLPLLRDACVFSTILTIAIYLLLPLSIWGGGRLSTVITDPALLQADQDLTNIRNNLFPETSSSPGILGKLQETKDKLGQVTQFIKKQTREMSLLVLKIIAGYLFDTIVFPLLLFLLFFHLTRMTTRYVFDLQRQRSLREDLDSLLAKYFKPGGSIF